MRLAVPNTCQNSGCSVLAQSLADATLGELVLTGDALGVDAQQDVHAAKNYDWQG